MIFAVRRIPEFNGKYAMAHSAAVSLLRDLLWRIYRLRINAQMIEKGPYGKPYLKGDPEIYFSISHCDEIVACAVDVVSIGIDVEKVRPWNHYAAKKILTSEETYNVVRSSCPNETFFRLWTMKESLAKADGRGLAYPFHNVSMQLKEGCPATVKTFGYEFSQRIIEEKYIFSVCRKMII